MASAHTSRTILPAIVSVFVVFSGAALAFAVPAPTTPLAGHDPNDQGVGQQLSSEETIRTWAFDHSLPREPNSQSPLAGEFLPPHLDHGYDADGNNLFDFLLVDAGVLIDMADIYSVAGFLHDSTYELLLFNRTVVFLELGFALVPVFFSGGLINRTGIDGPYGVDLFLEDRSGNLLDSGSHTSQEYDHADFEPVPVELAPPHADSAADSDGDGRYDVLNVHVNVTVIRAGRYGVVGVLHDGFTEIWVGAGFASLDPGPQTISVPFPGYAIRVSGIDGPYTVELGLVEYRGFQALEVNQHSTGKWDHLEFEELPSIPSPRAMSPPTIDGAIEGEEWADAFAEDLGALPGNQVPGFLYAMNDDEFVYLAYDAVGDPTRDPWDVASIGFDTGNDEIPTDGGEDQFVQGGWVTYDQGHFVYDSGFGTWILEDSPFDPGLPDHAGLAGAWGFGPSPAGPMDHRIYEFQIPLVLLGAQPGDVLGLFGGSRRSPGLFDHGAFGWTVWPWFTDQLVPLGSFGDLSLAEAPDSVPPEVAITHPPDGSFLKVDEVTVTWTASDEGSGLDRFEVQVDDREPALLPASELFYDVTDLSEGTHSIVVVAYDQTNNSAMASVTVMVDTTPPSVGITAPVEGEVIAASETTVTWTASDAQSGISRYEIQLDDRPVQALPPSATSFHFEALTDGPHEVDLTAFDAAGHETSASRSFRVDVTDPEVTIIGPGAVVGTNTFDVIWSARDTGAGLEQILLRLDDEPTLAFPGSETSHTFTAVPDGVHSIQVTAVDRVGKSATATTTVTVDTTDPTVTIASPQAGGHFTSSSVTLSFTTEDVTSGVDRIEVRVDGGPPMALEANATSRVLTGLADGEHVVSVTVYDRAGNVATNTVRFRVDTAFFSPSGPYGYGGLGLIGALTVAAVVAAVAIVRARRKSRPPAPPV